jgi:rSAM/selenodomain-associated transferase 1
LGRTFKRQLIVFTRFPVAGVTKTRLIPTLGAAGAALLQRKMTEHALKRVGRAHITPEPAVEIRFEGGDKKRMQAWLGNAYLYQPQRGDTLGDRMASAFEDAFQNRVDQAALIGTDIPGLTPATLESAFDSLGEADVVLGPASDGGYYLIGMHRGAFPAARKLFTNLNWGTDRVLADTLEIAAISGLRTRLLEELADVDSPEDLPVWEQEANNHP